MTCGHPNPSSPLQGHLSPVPVIRPSHEPRTNSLFSDPPSPASESSRKDYETLSDSIKYKKNTCPFRSSANIQHFFHPPNFSRKKTFLILLPDTIRNANRPIAARMREASSFAPNGQRLPKHLKNRPLPLHPHSLLVLPPLPPRSIISASLAHH